MERRAEMVESAWNLESLVMRFLEEVRERGFTARSSDDYRAACNEIVSFASASGEEGWSDDLAGRYLAFVEDRVSSGGISSELGRSRRRTLRLLASLAGTGEVDFSSAAKGRPARYPVDEDAAKVVEAIVRDAGAPGNMAEKLLAPVRHLLWYAGERGASPLEIDDALVMEFLVEEVPRTNGGSAGHALRCVKIATEWLKAHGGRVKRDYSMLTLKDGKRVLVPAFDESEIGRVVASIDTATALGKRDLAIILLAYCTGLRGADICRLKLSDVNWRAQSVSLVQSKTHAPITCELNGETMNALADYVLEGRPECDAPELFVTAVAPHGAIRGCLGSMFERRCRAAGVAKVPLRSFHSLRRAFETVMVSRGVPVETASQMMGHKSVEEDKPYITHDRATTAFIAMGFGDVPITAGAYAAAAEGGDES